MTTGQRLKLVIEDAGLTNNGFANRIGVSSTVINGIIHDTNKPGVKVLTAIQKTFPQYNTDWILTESGKMKSEAREDAYLLDILSKMERNFSELRDMLYRQLEGKDRQLEAKDKQLEMLISQLGKYSGVIEETQTKLLWSAQTGLVA